MLEKHKNHVKELERALNVWNEEEMAACEAPVSNEEAALNNEFID